MEDNYSSNLRRLRNRFNYENIKYSENIEELKKMLFENLLFNKENI